VKQCAVAMCLFVLTAIALLGWDHNPDPYDSAKKLAGERAEVSGKKFNKQGVNSIVVAGVKGL